MLTRQAAAARWGCPLLPHLGVTQAQEGPVPCSVCSKRVGPQVVSRRDESSLRQPRNAHRGKAGGLDRLREQPPAEAGVKPLTEEGTSRAGERHAP